MAAATHDLSPATHDVSVIVPAWNEESQLAACLRSVGVRRPGVELIVVDGGSTDRTVEIAGDFGASVVASPVRQRATQLNLAVQMASGKILLFLHADTVLPAGWSGRLHARLQADASIVGGAFARRFDHPSAWLRFTSALADWRGRLWGCFLGDQAIFIRASAFWSLGGFRPLDRCEDLDLSLRMARLGRTCLLSPPVRSSGRRFERQGPVRQTWADFCTACRFIGEHSAGSVKPDVAVWAARAPTGDCRQPASATPPGSARSSLP